MSAKPKTTLEFLSDLASQDIKLWVDEDRLRCSAPKGALTVALRQEVRERKTEILTFLRSMAPNSTLDSIGPVDRSEELLLSFAQQRLWFLSQLEGQSATYNVPAALHTIGPLHIAALEQSLTEIGQRHEILHTTFPTVKGLPVQVIGPNHPITLLVVDLQPLPEASQWAEVRRLTAEETRRPFDLAKGPLLRVTLLRLGEEEHVLLLTMHHIICDGWSIGIFIRELTILYEAFSKSPLGHKPTGMLPELPIQYADFAHWQRAQGVSEKQLNYWTKQLAEAPALLELPTDRPRPAVQGFRGSAERFEINAGLTQKLNTFCLKSGTTLFMTLLAVFEILLFRYSDQEDIVVGTPIANRNRRETEPLIGFFVNTLVLRTQLTGHATFQKVLAQVRQVTLDAYAHQDVPFEQVVETLQPTRNLSHPPLFQVMFAWQNAPKGKLELPSLTLTPLEIENITAKFDLTLSMEESEQGIEGLLEYNTDLFDAGTMARMAGHFQTLLAAMVANPKARVADLPLLTATERQQLLVEWNDTEVEYPVDQCIHQLFSQQVERTPNAVAVVSAKGAQLTYKELNSCANQLAHHLMAKGVGPEVLVGLQVEREPLMVVGLLAILKAGGAYVPLDPSLPKERRGYMLSDSRIEVLLTQEKLVSDLEIADVVCLDTEWEVISQESKENPRRKVNPTNLAYVIYTSGSTGKPKGVLVPHQGLCNLISEQIRRYEVQPTSRVLQFVSLSFDAATSHLFMALCSGATLVLAPNSVLPNSDLIQLLRDQAITLAPLPGSVLAALPACELPALRVIITGGEAAKGDLVAKWANGRRFFNEYGPTETTICVTAAECSDGSQKPPIGRPIDNTQLYILDRHLQPLPIGVPGELYIGGVGLTRGYLNRPELTGEKFIPNPVSSEPGARLYKTGDLTRYLPDGNIEFLGRIDHQVKIRGFRIELSEIEAVLTQHPEVGQAVVIVREDHPGDKRLVAYIVPSRKEGPTTTPSTWRSYVRQKLPEYMVPAAFVQLNKMPILPSGKIDRHALLNNPPPDTSTLARQESFVAPRNPIELQLVQIWEKMLNVRPIGILDNFFDLGGHSLLAVHLLADIEKCFEQKLPLSALFQRGTIKQMAEAISKESGNWPYAILVEIQPEGSKPPFFCVHPAGGLVTCYTDLARYLGPDQPFFGLQNPCLVGEHEPFATIEQMAEHYIDEILSFQPEGPYLLGGWSMGGIIAFEMAQQLIKAGHEVALLALLDVSAPTPNNKGAKINGAQAMIKRLIKVGSSLMAALLALLELLGVNINNKRQKIHNAQIMAQVLIEAARSLKKTVSISLDILQHLHPEEQIAYIREQFRMADEELPKEQLVAIFEYAKRYVTIHKGNMEALLHYVPQPYPHQMALLRTREIDPEHLKLAPSSANFTFGWGRFAAKSLEVHLVPGEHNTMVYDPYAQHLAEQLSACLDKACSRIAASTVKVKIDITSQEQAETRGESVKTKAGHGITVINQPEANQTKITNKNDDPSTSSIFAPTSQKRSQRIQLNKEEGYPEIMEYEETLNWKSILWSAGLIWFIPILYKSITLSAYGFYIGFQTKGDSELIEQGITALLESPLFQASFYVVIVLVILWRGYVLSKQQTSQVALHSGMAIGVGLAAQVVYQLFF